MNSPTPSVVRAEDPDAVQHRQTKVAAAEKLQATMKAANVIVRNRQLTDDEKVARLVAECGQREHSARELLKPDFAGRVGFPDYALTNNGANIRRMQARMKGLANESGRASVTLPFAGGRVEDNAAECRVRIYHDLKPPAGTIAKLRMYGFHWTPSLGCWHNAERRITPRPIDFCSDWYLFIRHNPAVIGLEFPEEAEQAVARAISAGLALVGACLRQDFFFQGEIRVQIDLGGLHGFVAQPDRNERAVDTGLEQFHCRGVAEHMRCDPLLDERGAGCACRFDMPCDQVLSGIGAEPIPTSIWEEELRVALTLSIDPSSDCGRRRLGQRGASFFSSFALAADMRTRSERYVLVPQTGQFGQAQTSLDRHQQEGVVALTQPRVPIRHREQYVNLAANQKVDHRARMPLARDGEHSLDQCGVFRCFQRGIPIERTDRRQSHVATTRNVRPLRLQLIQEGQDQRCIQRVKRKCRWRSMQAFFGKAEQQSKRIAIRRDRVWARPTLGHQSLREEAFEQ